MMISRDSRVPSGWIVTELQTVARVNPTLDKSRYAETLPVSFVPMPAVEAGTGAMDVSILRPFGQVRKGFTPFQQGDVLFAKITPCMENGKMALVPILKNGLGFGSTEFHVLRPYDGVEARYIYYFVSSQTFRRDAERKMTGGVGQRRVQTSYLAEHPIPLPPSREQARIVRTLERLLSEIDKGVDYISTARVQLGTLRQSMFRHMFSGALTAVWRSRTGNGARGRDEAIAQLKRRREATHQENLAGWRASVKDWDAHGKRGPKPSKPAEFNMPTAIAPVEVSRFPNIPDSWRYVRLCEIAQIGSGMSVSQARKLALPVEVPYLRVANVQRGHLDLSKMKTMRIERSQLSRLLLRVGDVLFNEGGDRDKLGRGWVWDAQIEPCITQNHVFRARPFVQHRYHSKWISYWGNAFGQSYFLAEGKQTTNLASINKHVLSAFPIPLPPFHEQKQAIDKLEAQLAVIDHLEVEVGRSLERLVALRHTILRRAFNGTLVAQDPTDEPASALLERIRASKDGASTRAKRKKKAMKKRKSAA